jgi:hypothetical protein
MIRPRRRVACFEGYGSVFASALISLGLLDGSIMTGPCLVHRISQNHASSPASCTVA